MNAAMRTKSGARGQPLLVMFTLLGMWIGLRALLWQTPFVPIMKDPIFGDAPRGEASMAAATSGHSGTTPREAPGMLVHPPLVPGPLDSSSAMPLPPPWPAVAVPEEPLAAPFPLAPAARPPEQRVVGQQLLLAAAFSHMELPPEIAAYFTGSAPNGGVRPLAAELRPAGRPSPPQTGPRRWSADAWLLLRQDSAGLIAAGEPSYGRSQAGAVLRYRLAPSSGHRPVAYARATGAIAEPRETELAVGVAVRPIPGLPVTLAAEVRAYDSRGHRELRPAALAVTELSPAKLPLGLRGEAYAQAGYVGGRFATAFVDGQARVDERVVKVGRTGEVRAGAGLWGGAQKGTDRLDIGPSATVSFRLGQGQARLAADYRWRVAGNAEPESGPALTISAGF